MKDFYYAWTSFAGSEWDFRTRKYRDLTLQEVQDNYPDTLKELTTAPILALDLETTGLDPLKDEIVLITLATQDCAYIFAPAHFELLRPIFTDRSRHWLLQYAPFDLSFIYAKFGVQLSSLQVYDTRVQEKQAQLRKGTKESCSLAPMVERYLKMTLPKDEQLSFTHYKPGDHLTTNQLQYAANDALVLSPIAFQQLLIAGHWLTAHEGLQKMYAYVDGTFKERPDSR